MSQSDEEMTFREFTVATAKEGHPLFKGLDGTNLEMIAEYLFHFLILKISPKWLEPRETDGELDHSNVARLPKKTWHGYYAEALMSLLTKENANA